MITKPNLILVHGAWHGAWVWEPVLPTLEAHFNVIALDLPGRKPNAPFYKKISLKSYVQAIEQCLLTLEGPIFLLGHSLAGLAISQVAENHPDKIDGLIYVAAFIPQNGESLFDIASNFKSPGASSELIFEQRQNILDIQKSEKTKTLFFNACPEALATQALAHVHPEPFKAFTTPVTLSANNFGRVKKIYIQCTEDLAIPPLYQTQMAQNAGITEIIDLKADHSPYFSHPQGMCEMLINTFTP